MRSLCSLGFALGVVGFIRGRWVYSDSPWGSLGTSEVVAFTLRLALWVVGLIRRRWDHSVLA